MTTPARPPANSTPAKTAEALVYVPGLTMGLAPNRTPQGVIDRVARAMDAQALETATFSVEWHDAIFGKGDSDKPAATIQRTDGEDTRPVVDVYFYEWATGFRDRWESQNLFKRAGRTLLGLLGVPKFIRFFNTSGKRTPFGRMQLGIAVAAAFLVVAYAAVLLVALGQLVYQTVQAQQPPAVQSPTVVAVSTANADSPSTETATPSPEAATPSPEAANAVKAGSSNSHDKTATLTLIQWLAILGAAGAAVVPRIRERVNELGATLSAASSYLRVARDKPTVLGGLEAMIAGLNDSGQYKHVRLVSYSFGAIVALDTLFPTTSQPPRLLSKVDKLVTIGCPFEFATAMHKNWLSGRKNRENVPTTWLNIYSPVDLLGSDFTTQVKQETDSPASIEMVPQATATAVKPTTNHGWDLGIEPTWSNLIEFHGFSSHSMYWGTDKEIDRNVFVEVVEHLYGGTPILA